VHTETVEAVSEISSGLFINVFFGRSAFSQALLNKNSSKLFKFNFSLPFFILFITIFKKFIVVNFLPYCWIATRNNVFYLQLWCLTQYTFHCFKFLADKAVGRLFGCASGRLEIKLVVFDEVIMQHFSFYFLFWELLSSFLYKPAYIKSGNSIF
jgi:hypothetical protein